MRAQDTCSQRAAGHPRPRDDSSEGRCDGEPDDRPIDAPAIWRWSTCRWRRPGGRRRDRRPRAPGARRSRRTATASPTSPTGRGSRASRVAAVDRRTPPAVLSGPDQEVVSVAWSPDGAWLAYLVSPGGSICAELHVVRPTAPAAAASRGGPAATVFAGGWTGPGHYVCSIALGDGRTPTSSWSPWTPGSSARSPGRLPVRERGVRRRAVPAGPPRPARLPAHRRDRSSPPASSAGCCRSTHRRDRLRGRPVRPDGRSVHVRASLPGRARHRPRRSGARPAVRGRRPRPGPRRPVPPGRRPGRLRPARRRHRAGGVDVPRGHRAVGARPVRRVAAAAGRSCRSRSCRAGRWPPTARRCSPS